MVSEHDLQGKESMGRSNYVPECMSCQLCYVYSFGEGADGYVVALYHQDVSHVLESPRGIFADGCPAPHGP